MNGDNADQSIVLEKYFTHVILSIRHDRKIASFKIKDHVNN